VYPVPPETPYPTIGDPGHNGAVFVREFIRNPPPQGSFVRCNVETFTIDSWLAVWGKATGIAPEDGATAAVQISPEAYVRLWGHMGVEQLSQWKFFQWIAQHKVEWDGITMVEGYNLLSDEDKKQLLTAEESIKRYDWSSIKKKPTASSSEDRFAKL
jgi:hypothetical protein